MPLKKLHLWVAVIGIALAAGAAWWWQHRPAPAAPGAASANSGNPAAGTRGGPPAGPAPVEIGKAELATLRDDAVAVGSLRSRQRVMLRPEVSGRVVQLNFLDGQPVRRGQLLVQLDDTLQQAQLKQAQAESGIAATNLKRNRELVAQNFVSQSALDQSAAALQVAQAQVALAQAQLSRMRLLAPFDGQAGIRLVDLGEVLQSGAEIVNIEDTAAMLVDFRLPEHVLSKLKPGQAVDLSLDALPGREFRGTVDALDAQLDANGRSLLVRARLDNPDGTLRPGMFARARVVFATREQAVVVPEEALVPQDGKLYLVKVVPAEGGDVSRRIEARIGLRVPGKVEIIEGLNPGDRVVTAGQAALMRGDALPLKVVDIDAAPNGPRDAASGAAAPARAAPPASAPRATPAA